MKEAFLKIVSGIIGILLIFFLIKWGMQIQNKQDEKYPWTASIYTETQILDSKEYRSLFSFGPYDKHTYLLGSQYGTKAVRWK